MKHSLLFITALMLIISCAEPPSLIPEKLIVSGYDFAKYSENGFLFTPNSYEGDYESIGLVQLTYMPEAKHVYITKETMLRETVTTKDWLVSDINPAKGIEEIYNVCIEMGADAMTQMEIESYSVAHAQNTTMPITLTGIKISGFAIKRLGAFK